MQIKRDFVLRCITGEKILVPVGKTAIDINGLVVLNEVGAFIWERIPQAADEQAIVDMILEEYDVSREEAAADAAAFLDKLRKLDILA